MPKETFHNLKEEKRSRFLDASFREFSIKGYYGASLTQLVKDLEIAKGSLYQYFDDKRALFSFLIAEACSRRQAFFDVLTGKPASDYLFNYFVISLKFDATYPALASLIYNGLSTFNPETITIIEREFCEKIPQNYQGEGIPLLLAAEGNFLILVRNKELVLSSLIESEGEIDVSSEEILSIVQKNMNI